MHENNLTYNNFQHFKSDFQDFLWSSGKPFLSDRKSYFLSISSLVFSLFVGGFNENIPPKSYFFRRVLGNFYFKFLFLGRSGRSLTQQILQIFQDFLQLIHGGVFFIPASLSRILHNSSLSFFILKTSSFISLFLSLSL